MNKEYISYNTTITNTLIDNNINKLNEQLNFMENRLKHNHKIFEDVKNRLCDLYQLYEKLQNNEKINKIKINKIDNTVNKYKNIEIKVETLEDDVVILNEFAKTFKVND